MPNPVFSIFSLSKNPNKAKLEHLYTKWFKKLTTIFLPNLEKCLSIPSSSPTLLSSHVCLLHHHILSYYDALDAAAIASPSLLPHILFPSWRTSLERPYLFLGDLHPYFFTNLLRSFIDDQETENGLGNNEFDLRWMVVMAWEDPEKSLTIKIEQIERGLRLMVPALMDRVKKVQVGFVKRVVKDYVSFDGKKERVDVGEAMKVELEELVRVFLDTNRLRRSAISEILGALNVYQSAMFLQGFVRFLIGFKDSRLLKELNKSKTLIGN